MPSSPQRDKLVKEIEAKLSAMTPVGSKQRGTNDFFVFVTIEITKDHHVTVDYPVIQGVKEAAGKIADFLLRNEKACPQVGGVRPREEMKAAQKQLALAKEKSIDAKLTAFPMTKKDAKKDVRRLVRGRHSRLAVVRSTCGHSFLGAARRQDDG